MSITALLVDDHTVVREGLRFLLDARADIEVVGEADSGREALDLVAELHPDVVVLDIAMPGLSGIEAARRVRGSSPSTQVVILSMHSTREHVFRALQAGALGYLVKESAGAELVEAVRAAHAGHRYLSQRIEDRVIDEYIREREGAEVEGPLACLSPREQEVLRLVVEGKTSEEIGDILSLSPKTIETYRSRMMRKLDISGLPGLVKFAIKHGLTSLD